MMTLYSGPIGLNCVKALVWQGWASGLRVSTAGKKPSKTRHPLGRRVC
jgi:hypothetical protein